MRVAIVMLLAGACSHDPEPPAAPSPALAHPEPARPKDPPRPQQLSRVTIKALGMYCEESCPMRVRYALGAMPQIYELGFDLTKESIFISYDASLGTPKQVTKPMLAAIKQAGFDPWLAKESWPSEATAQVVPR
ncbi:MAG: hypothetical protein JWO36_3999 [Myxococcales bacterium]|nr:hypothetical protein [Myxococcales bacterium]